ncbi:hypothetical protein V8V93_02265 [Pseudodesulfovibrio methanolicus]|uniref:MFS transporter n=1 Tax=Pseudodesulfovibrio methanolicus TaxID=3126690 RepID=A0ABZ2IWG5_9BACT
MKREVLHSRPLAQDFHEVLSPLIRGAVLGAGDMFTNPLFMVF